jgi:benzoylformate decarboxylase
MSMAETPTRPKEIYRTVSGTGGTLLVEQLKAAGVEYVFTNPGSTEVGFFDALADAPDLQLIMGLHEGIVIPMADGYYQVTGKPAFVNVHTIAGTAQMAGQLYNADWNRAAMVVTAALVDPTVFSDNAILAPRPGYTQAEVVKQFTKISWEVRNAASIPLALRRAFKVATTPPEGPVYVALASYALTAPGVTAEVIDQSKFTIPMRVRPEATQIEQAALWLVESACPLITVGPALQRSAAIPKTVSLAEAIGVPVLDTVGFVLSGSGFPTQHPLCYDGRAAMFGPPSFYDRCDVVVGLGNENLVPAGEDPARAARLPRHARKVAIGLDTGAMGRTEPIDLPIVADVGMAVSDLLDAVNCLLTNDRLRQLRDARYERTVGEIAAYRRDVEQAVRGNFGKQPMAPDEVGMIIDERLDPEAITVHENLSADLEARFGVLLRYGEGGKRRLASGGSCLGWGVGAAIGAKLGAPDRQVVLQIGDGSVMYSAAGFWTMARYAVPILTIVWNNQNYETVRHTYARYQGAMARTGHYPGMYLGDPEINFVRLAESQGVAGQRAVTPDELRSALTRGIAATRAGEPYLIDVRVGRTGPGADSIWHEQFNLASRRRREM